MCENKDEEKSMPHFYFTKWMKNWTANENKHKREFEEQAFYFLQYVGKAIRRKFTLKKNTVSIASSYCLRFVVYKELNRKERENHLIVTVIWSSYDFNEAAQIESNEMDTRSLLRKLNRRFMYHGEEYK